jgi:hydroxyacylglutathione hydrolase
LTSGSLSLDSSGMFEILLIPAFKDNYIWLLVRDGHAAFVVDPGDANPVIARLEALQLQLDRHPDHPPPCRPSGRRRRACRTLAPEVFGPAKESITGCTDPLSGGERIEVLGQAVDVLQVGGHTRAHLAYYVPGAVFCGDTLFGAGCGRLFEGTPAQMCESLARLAALPDETRIYCAHEYTEMNLRFAVAVEPHNRLLRERVERVARLRAAGLPSVPSTLGEEKATNPFLRCGEPAVVAAAQAHGAVDLSLVPVFAAIRGWRNSF